MAQNDNGECLPDHAKALRKKLAELLMKQYELDLDHAYMVIDKRLTIQEAIKQQEAKRRERTEAQDRQRDRRKRAEVLMRKYQLSRSDAFLVVDGKWSLEKALERKQTSHDEEAGNGRTAEGPGGASH